MTAQPNEREWLRRFYNHARNNNTAELQLLVEAVRRTHPEFEVQRQLELSIKDRPMSTTLRRIRTIV